MAVIQIKPIHTTTSAGWPAVIDGICPGSDDFLHGNITTPGAGTIDAIWDGSGICRDKTDQCNLNMRNQEVFDAAQTARALRKVCRP